jgi:hypothetical protein
MNSYDSIISLSLGTVAEPSGLVVVKPWSSMYPPDGLAPEAGVGNRFDVVWIERFPAGCPLPAILNRVSEIASLKRVSRESVILLDISSVGTAPLRAFQTRGMYPAAIDLTNTGAEGFTNDAQQAPLRDVIGAAQVVVETARLRLAKDLELTETLVSDLQAFDPKPIARHPDLRGGRNADLVLALAVALWWGDRLTWDDDMLDHYAADDAAYERNPVSGY